MKKELFEVEVNGQKLKVNADQLAEIKAKKPEPKKQEEKKPVAKKEAEKK